MPKVGNVANFLQALKHLREERRKAENVLLDEVETDIRQKERFLTEQIETLQEMNKNLNTLIEHRSVIQIASNIIAGTQEEQARAREAVELEENKQEIQMQNLEGAASSRASASRPAPSINNAQPNSEQKEPLIKDEELSGPRQVTLSYLAGTIARDE